MAWGYRPASLSIIRSYRYPSLSGGRKPGSRRWTGRLQGEDARVRTVRHLGLSCRLWLDARYPALRLAPCLDQPANLPAVTSGDAGVSEMLFLEAPRTQI